MAPITRPSPITAKNYEHGERDADGEREGRERVWPTDARALISAPSRGQDRGGVDRLNRVRHARRRRMEVIGLFPHVGGGRRLISRTSISRQRLPFLVHIDAIGVVGLGLRQGRSAGVAHESSMATAPSLRQGRRPPVNPDRTP